MFIAKYFKDSFTKNIFVLLGGTGIAQLVPFVISFFLARIYSPDQYGIFGLLTAAIGPLSVLVCGRYELAVVLPIKDESAIALVGAGWMFNVFLSLFAFVFCFIFNTFFTDTFGIPQLKSVLFLIPFFIALIGFSQPVTYWLQRKQAFKAIALNKIIQTSAIAFLSLAFGILEINEGLMLGYLCGWFIMVLFSAYQLKKSSFNFNKIELSEIKSQAYFYKNYPLYNLIPAFLNALTFSIPYWIISLNFANYELGQFNLVRQLLVIITSVGATIFTQIYYQRSVNDFNNKSSLWPDFKRILISLTTIAIFFTTVFTVWGEYVFQLLYGDIWKISGNYSEILIFSTAIQFIVLPLSVVLNTLGKIKLNSIWQLFYFFSICTLFLFQFSTVKDVVIVYTFVEIVCFIPLFFMIYSSIIQYEKNLVKN